MHPRLIPCLVTLAGVVACAGKLPFRDAPAQPAAVAEARLTLDENGNALVKLWVQHLAPPEQPSSPYVMTTDFVEPSRRSWF